MKIPRIQLFVAQLLVLAFAPCSFEAAGLAAGSSESLPTLETSENADEGTNEAQSEDTAQESASESESSEQADGASGNSADENSRPADGDPV